MIKYVIFGPTFEATDALFDEIKDQDYVEYVQYPIKSKFAYFLSRIHMNRLRWIPAKKIWSFIYKKTRSDGKYYIYCNPWSYFMYASGYVKKLKKEIPNSYHIAYLTDINSAQKLPLNDMKKIYDAIYIFDKSFAENNKIKYYPLVYSREKTTDMDCYDSDVVFIGQSKGRSEKLVKIYDKLTAIGLKCDFWIVDELNEEATKPGLHFINKPMNPHQSVAHLIRSKVVLELKSSGIDALSDRVIKAVVYNKNILTDNTAILDFKFYNAQKVYIFYSVDDIGCDIINNFDKEYCYNNDYSPVKFLEHIEKSIE